MRQRFGGTEMKEGEHRNKLTGEVLSRSYQWCRRCGQNFSSTRAGDKHRVGKFLPESRECLTGKDAKLISFRNVNGAIVYRLG